ncbi:MAG: carbamoyltransferase family protein [Planctomycetota bacterium]
MKPSKNRVVLGLNAYSHDAGVALVVDGELVFAAEEERYDRLKHSHAFPAGAVRAALGHAGLEAGDVDAVAFCWRKDMARLKKALYVLRHLPRSLAFLRERPERLPPRLRYLRSVAHLAHDLRASGVRAPVTWVEHHFAHAVQAHRFGPADEAALLTADGMGEWTAAAAWQVERGGPPRLLGSQHYPHSLGKVYAAVTQHVGFRPDADEGKTMGLASYGRPALREAFRRLVRPHEKKLYEVDLRAFAYPWGHTRMGGAPFTARFGPPRTPEGPIEARDEDLAYAAQAVLEDTVLGVARRLREQTGASHLGLAGGLFLNCVLNGRLAREAGFDSLFVFPAAGDAGAAAGAAAWVAGMERRLLRHAYLGDPCDIAAVDRALAGRPWRVASDPAAAAAEALAAGRIVGWFNGRMEFGPRALGARSILADPRGQGIKDRLNAKVKFREAFRPFAPAVLEEVAGDWFADARPSPFMLLAFAATDRAREGIPGVVHVDGSARVQTVGRDDGQPLFRRLLEAFLARTGVPVVLNTSFNVRGEPIVRTPDQALACFDRTGMDLLVLGDRVVEKA